MQADPAEKLSPHPTWADQEAARPLDGPTLLDRVAVWLVLSFCWGIFRAWMWPLHHLTGPG